MRTLVCAIICCFSFQLFAQNVASSEEFLPINLEGKEAFLSTKTGEYVFREHAKTDPTRLETTKNGVIYTDIIIHKVAKRETLSRISKKYNISVDEVIQQNKLKKKKLSLGQELKITKKLVIASSSPVISQAESTIVARLQPGQSPTNLNPPPANKPNPVPSSNNSMFHEVKAGDTLFSIAKKYGITVQTLKGLNKLTTNTISIGEKLKVQ